MKNVRIKDIALKAKVSTGTVDRVLHDRGRVSESVKKSVLKAIEDMEYEPNLMARTLVSNKVYNLAVLLADSQIDSYWEDPQKGIEQAQKELKMYNVNVLLYVFDPYSVSSFIEKAKELTASNPSGIFLSPIFYRETMHLFKQWSERSIPFVLFNTNIEGCNSLSYIGQDSYQSGMLAGKLVEYGQSEPCSILIAHIDEDTSNSAHLTQKEQGFRDFFTQNLLTDKFTLMRAELNRADFSSFNNQLDSLIQNTPDLKSIFVTTSKAYEIATYLEQRRLKSIKIIGYDLIPKNISFLNKGYISFLINQNPKGQGYWGIQYLARYLVFKKEVPSVKYLPLDVVTKENVSYYVGDNDDMTV